MPRYEVICDPNVLHGVYEADDEDGATMEAMDDWCPCLGAATDAVTAGSFTVRLVEP